MILSEIVEMVESSNKCLYLSVQKSYLFLFNYAICLIVAQHNFMEDLPKFLILLTKQSIG